MQLRCWRSKEGPRYPIYPIPDLMQMQMQRPMQRPMQSSVLESLRVNNNNIYGCYYDFPLPSVSLSPRASSATLPHLPDMPCLICPAQRTFSLLPRTLYMYCTSVNWPNRENNDDAPYPSDLSYLSQFSISPFLHFSTSPLLLSSFLSLRLPISPKDFLGLSPWPCRIKKRVFPLRCSI